MKKEFNPSRLTLARMRRGYSQWDIAMRLETKVPVIYKYEKGQKTPNEETLQALSEVLHFPVDFFFGPTLEIPQI